MSDFDGLADEARAASGSNRRRGCAVGDLLAGLPDDDAAKVVDVLEDRNISARAISEALRKRVGEAAPTTFLIGYHRRRDCHCYRGVELK